MKQDEAELNKRKLPSTIADVPRSGAVYRLAWLTTRVSIDVGTVMART